jgi:hypothetical protein
MRVRTLFAAMAPAAALLLTAASPATPDDEHLKPRIRAHFDSVLVELGSRDLTALSQGQRERRATLIERLRRYRDRGVFPHNYDFPGEAVPYFVDRRTGTLCAVAHLLESTGRRDIVNRVAAANNNVWVAQLAGDAQFEHWLSDHGLTLAEAARIQVPYENVRPVVQDAAAHSMLPAAVGAGAAGVIALNLMSNRDGHGRLRNWMGLTAGLVNVALGADAIGSRRQAGTGKLNLAAGALSTVVTTHAMLRHRSYVARKNAESTRVAVAPVMPTAESGAGLSLNVRF